MNNGNGTSLSSPAASNGNSVPEFTGGGRITNETSFYPDDGLNYWREAHKPKDSDGIPLTKSEIEDCSIIIGNFKPNPDDRVVAAWVFKRTRAYLSVIISSDSRNYIYGSIGGDSYGNRFYAFDSIYFDNWSPWPSFSGVHCIFPNPHFYPYYNFSGHESRGKSFQVKLPLNIRFAEIIGFNIFTGGLEPGKTIPEFEDFIDLRCWSWNWDWADWRGQISPRRGIIPRPNNSIKTQFDQLWVGSSKTWCEIISPSDYECDPLWLKEYKEFSEEGQQLLEREFEDRVRFIVEKIELTYLLDSFQKSKLDRQKWESDMLRYLRRKHLKINPRGMVATATALQQYAIT